MRLAHNLKQGQESSLSVGWQGCPPHASAGRGGEELKEQGREEEQNTVPFSRAMLLRWPGLHALSVILSLQEKAVFKYEDGDRLFAMSEMILFILSPVTKSRIISGILYS